MVPKNNNNKHSKYNQSSATNGCIIWHSDIIVVTDLKQSFQLALIPNVLFTVQHKCVYGEGSLCWHTCQHDYIRINLSQRKSSFCQASGFTWGRSAKSQLWHLTSTGLLFTVMGSTHLFPINLKGHCLTFRVTFLLTQTTRFVIYIVILRLGVSLPSVTARQSEQINLIPLS